MPDPPDAIYGRHAAAFDAATALDELPDEFHSLLESFVEALPGPAVLDAGCGPGRDVAYFARHDLDPVGVDIAPGMIEYARSHRPGQYMVMDIRRLGFHADRFDGVWCPASIFFMPTDEMVTAVTEFARVLRPGGVARIGFKLGEGSVEVDKWDGTMMEYRVSKHQARDVVEIAGFDVESVSVNTVASGQTFANVLCLYADGTTK